jgi:predicted acetyltransferase
VDFTFYDPGLLLDDDLALRLEQALVDVSGWEPVPTYKFRMVNSRSNSPIGFLNLRVGTAENLIRYRGRVGFAVDAEHRGTSAGVRVRRSAGRS